MRVSSNVLVSAAFVATAAIFGFHGTPQADPYADAVAVDGINNQSCGGDCIGEASGVLGAPDFEPGLNQAVLGTTGGFITLNFLDNFCAVDGTGAADVRVVEVGASFGGVNESFQVEVGIIGGALSGSVASAGDDSFLDLTTLGITGFNQIRITSTSNTGNGNNFAGADIDAVECLNSVGGDINIKPDSDPNSVNTCSGGTTPVIIWGSSDLDVSKIIVNQLVLEGGTVKMVGKSNKSLCNIADVGARDVAFFDDLDPGLDSFDDLTCHFQTFNLTGLEENDTTANLTIIGCDDPTFVGDVALCEPGDTGFFQFVSADSINIVKDCD